jgi:NAD(P)H-hydrate repair Nnr-like enzyme with NAD(P)H-hydrate dehydratase domain
VEATRAVADTDRLDLLVAHPATVVITPHPDDWRALAATSETVGRLDTASAVLAAIDVDCLVLTGQPGLYAGLAGGGPIIAI